MELEKTRDRTTEPVVYEDFWGGSEYLFWGPLGTQEFPKNLTSPDLQIRLQKRVYTNVLGDLLVFDDRNGSPEVLRKSLWDFPILEKSQEMPKTLCI